MRASRRRILCLAASAAAASTVPRWAGAQAYPTRPVRLVVGFPPGGIADLLTRWVGQWLSEHLGKPFIVENRPGAGSNIATEVVVRASPDGHTLLLAGTPNVINATLYEKLNFDFRRDIKPVAGIARIAFVMVIHPLLPARTVSEFIAYAKANPGRINMASGGNGVPSHVAGELFKMMTDVDMVHVPYRGASPALADLMGGQVQVMFSDISAVEQVRAGKLRALAVTTRTRLEALLPGVPTVGDFVPGYEVSGWFGLGAPKDTPHDLIAAINKEVNAALADPKLKARILDAGCTLLVGSTSDFGRLITAETEKWAKVVKFAGIKPN